MENDQYYNQNIWRFLLTGLGGGNECIKNTNIESLLCLPTLQTSSERLSKVNNDSIEDQQLGQLSI